MNATLKKLRDSLVPLYGKSETEAIIRLIFHYVKGWSLTDILVNHDKELSPFVRKEIDAILSRLLKNEPIQYITGLARFYGLDIEVNNSVLIPRHETEELVDIIIDRYKDVADLKILDLCTGSGCIAIALTRNLPFANITALDISEEALEVAIHNSKRLKVKINFINEDIFKWETGERFDIIVSNPPYVMDKEALIMNKNVLNYEPHEAIFVRDEEPLIFYDRIAEICKFSLKPEGKLFLEINPLVVKDLKDLLLKKGLSDIEVIKDISGKDRFIIASFGR